MDGQERGQLEWPESPIGMHLAVDCPCAQAAVRQAIRVCGGDFASGGRWMESDVTPCQFDRTAWELCSTPVCCWPAVHEPTDV